MYTEDTIPMREKYYIPNLPFLKDNLKEHAKALISQDESNIVHIDSWEDVETLLASIEEMELVRDSQLKKDFKLYFPDMGNFFTQIPVTKKELMEAFMFIFNDEPRELLESDDALSGLSKFLNHLIQKNESMFITENIRNGTLRYDKSWKHRRFQEFYFHLKKMAYNLDVYYPTFCNAQYLLIDTAFRDLRFSDGTIRDTYAERFNHAFNLCGRNMLDMKKRVKHIKNQISENKRFLKRTSIIDSQPSRYFDMEREATSKIDETMQDLDTRIEQVDGNKRRLQEEFKQRHGILSKQTVRKFMQNFKKTAPFFPKDRP